MKARWDGEYYDPVHLKIEEELERVGCIELANVAKDIRCGPFGSAIHKEDYRDSGVPLIRVADTAGPFVKGDDLIFIDQKLARELARHIVKPGDIVVSQRGTIAQFAMVTDEYEEWVTSANLIAILRSRKADFGYLLAFLNSHLGLSQMMRLQSGQVQPKIVTDDVKSVHVYLPSQEIQKSVGDLTREGYQLFQRSKSLYAEAEALLLAELGLDALDLSHQPTYTQNASQVWAAGRLDSNYWGTEYTTLVSYLKTRPHSLLGDLADFANGATPRGANYLAEGIPFLRIQNVGKNRLELGDVVYIDGATHNELLKRSQLRPRDVLITITGRIGTSAVVPDDMLVGNINQHIVRMRLRGKETNSYYLAAFLNSKAGRLQTEREAYGTTREALPYYCLERVIVPEASEALQASIEAKIREAEETSNEAKRLLEEAKRRVEQMVLGG